MTYKGVRQCVSRRYVWTSANGSYLSDCLTWLTAFACTAIYCTLHTLLFALFPMIHPSNLFIHMPIYVLTHPMYMSREPLSQYSPTEDLNNCHYDSIKYSQRIDWRAAPEILSRIFFTTHSVQYMVAVDKKS